MQINADIQGSATFSVHGPLALRNDSFIKTSATSADNSEILLFSPAAEHGQSVFEVGWKWRLELHLFAGRWVSDCKSVSMKGVAIQQAFFGFRLVILSDFAA